MFTEMHCKMKGLILFALFISCQCLPFKEFQGNWMIISDEDLRVQILDLTEDVTDSVVSDKDVGFYYFSRTTEKEIELFVDKMDSLPETDFDPNKKTLYSVHGWNNDKNSHINQLIKEALKNRTDFNLFIVNWPASNLYNICKSRVPSVGSILARFIQNTGQDLADVFISGHSLGAHVAGKAGKSLGGKLVKIIGLDPAYPFFDYENLDERLDSTDAIFVEVIHTCGGFLGFMNPLGHVDFYPNGGMVQEGCGANWLGICSHSRSYEYFAESLKSGGFLGTLCDNYDNFKSGKCDNNLKSYMGGLDKKIKPTGMYFLNTRGESPYALN